MRCKTIRATADRSDDDETRRVVVVTMGNMRRVGAIDEVAWIEMPSGMARQIAADLIEAADAIEK